MMPETRPRLLDLFCGAGGAAYGYQQAGFQDITGVDIKPQPRYPFRFVQADALEYLAEHGHEYDLIHASPPCQFGSEATPMLHRVKHPNLIPETRTALKRINLPSVIENVENVRWHLDWGLMLCGTMFGLPLWRHRYFELGGFECWAPTSCNHERRPVTLHPGSNTRKLTPVLVTGTTRRSQVNGGRFEFSVKECRAAMEIDWMTRDELDEAIPPAYTRFIGAQLRRRLEAA